MKNPIPVLFAALALAACAHPGKNPAPGGMNRVLYRCDNGERVEMHYFPERETATLIRNGRSLELRQRPAGSGVIYSNGPNTVRGKGREIMLELARMAPITCRETP
ncbi:MAG: MliC family protein [Candidatus Accumulibacter sp.]|jgi:membrane-bound inhibitor of C-type lysozyme|nr:MliC family protein [Accumulibacter sp.]